MKNRTLFVCGAFLMAATTWAGLNNPVLLNASFEEDVLASATKTAMITDWWNRTAYCWAAEETNEDFPATPYGANWTEFGNLSWVYQQIGTWEAGRQLRVSFLLGSIRGTDFPGVRVSLWAGGDTAKAADGNPSIPSTTLETAVRATQIAVSDLIKPAVLYSDRKGDYEFLGTGQISEESVILSTGSGRTPGESLWLLIQAGGRRRTLIDNISVIYMSSNPTVVNPTPGDYAEGVDPVVTIHWEVVSAKSPGFSIHIGTTYACDDVLVSNTGSAMTYTPLAGILHYGTTYYWRVDTWDEGYLYPGPVWRFTTGGKAGDPVPQDGGTADRSVSMLSWQDDLLVDSYSVYFGHPGELQFVGNYTVTNVSFGDLAEMLNHGILAAGQYQWRIDTRDVNDKLILVGDVWNVTIPDVEPIVLEDFHTYKDTSALLAKWLGADGASLALEDVYGSMRLDYDSQAEPWKSRVTLTFNSPQDWVGTGLDTIAFSFCGLETNAAERISLMLSDGANDSTIMHPQVSASTSTWWQTWYVRLSDLSEAGVDLGSITTVTICVGDGTAPGGTGTLYVDDLSLFLVGCIEEFYPSGDLNADCEKTLADLAILASDWLVADFEIVGVAPDNQKLLAHYSFDEESGTLAADSSGLGYHATIKADNLGATWDDSGHNGGCVRIDVSTTVTVPAEVFGDVNEEMTISMWINGQQTNFPIKVNEASFAAGSASEAQSNWDVVTWMLDSAEAYSGQWNHYAVVKNAAVGIMRLYHNGIIVAEITGATDPIEGGLAEDTILELAGFDVGTSPTVKVDELRVYGYALSHSEVAYLATDGARAIKQPVEPIYTSYDMNDDGAVNLSDFAIIASAWLSD